MQASNISLYFTIHLIIRISAITKNETFLPVDIYKYVYASLYIRIYLYILLICMHIYVIKISLLYLQKLYQYNEDITKHQTKINTALNTNELKLQKD